MLILEKVMAGNIITTNLCDRSDWHLDDCVNKVVIEKYNNVMFYNLIEKYN